MYTEVCVNVRMLNEEIYLSVVSQRVCCVNDCKIACMCRKEIRNGRFWYQHWIYWHVIIVSTVLGGYYSFIGLASRFLNPLVINFYLSLRQLHYGNETDSLITVQFYHTVIVTFPYLLLIKLDLEYNL